MNNELLTPLLSTAITGNYPAYRALLVGGASVKDRNANGRSVVHIAAYKNHPEFLRVSDRLRPSDLTSTALLKSTIM